jgi:hypothetical protein
MELLGGAERRGRPERGRRRLVRLVVAVGTRRRPNDDAALADGRSVDRSHHHNGSDRDGRDGHFCSAGSRVHGGSPDGRGRSAGFLLGNRVFPAPCGRDLRRRQLLPRSVSVDGSRRILDRHHRCSRRDVSRTPGGHGPMRRGHGPQHHLQLPEGRPPGEHVQAPGHPRDHRRGRHHPHGLLCGGVPGGLGLVRRLDGRLLGRGRPGPGTRPIRLSPMAARRRGTSRARSGSPPSWSRRIPRRGPMSCRANASYNAPISPSTARCPSRSSRPR